MQKRSRPCRVASAVVWCVAAVAGASGCNRDTPTSPTPVDTLDDAFAQARLETNIRNLVVSRGGAVVRAEYFNGGGPDSTEYVWSVTKSVLALTVGAALQSGCLRALDQTLGELLGPAMVTDPAKAPVTLRHVLTMSSGIDFPEASFYATGPSGWGGQFVAVVPARRLVVTTASRTTGLSGPAAMAQWNRIFTIVFSLIVPAF